MIKITYNTERHPNAPTRVKEWSIGDSRLMFSKSFLWGIQTVEASGEEIKFMLGMFKNLPTCEREQIVWVGEFAKFIVTNFCNLE